jgi:hypothetical protein
MVSYIDNFPIMHQDFEETMNIFGLITQLLTKLGFIIKKEKCSLAPTQEIIFLGALLNSRKMIMAVPNDKIISLQTECRKLMREKKCLMKELATVLGRMSHMARIGIWEAPLHYRKTQNQFIAMLHEEARYSEIKNKQIYLYPEVITEMHWWTSIELIQSNKMSLILPPFDMIMSSDASTKGWGAFCQGVSGWDRKESNNHINVLELKAALLAVQSFVSTASVLPHHIQLLMDNPTAVAYLAELSLRIWTYCLSRNIWITAKHLPGIQNEEADFASRNFNNRTEWTLDKDLFNYFTPQVDLFASRINHQLPLYVARYPDPGDMAVDSFSLKWNQWTVFIHPPIVLLPRILLKLREDSATGLVIAPTWRGQPWFPALLEMLMDYPAQIPMSETVLTLPFDQEAVHPMWRTLRLAVWPLSGLVSRQQEFRQRCARSSWPPGEKSHKKYMKRPGSCGIAGVLNGISVHFQHL